MQVAEAVAEQLDEKVKIIEMDVLASNLPQLLEVASGVDVAFKIGKDLEQRLTGRFYTHERVGQSMAKDIVERLCPPLNTLRIIDPFCGDGRLVCWLLDELISTGKFPTSGIHVALWDCDEQAIPFAEKSVRALLSKAPAGTAITLDARVVDSFAEVLHAERTFDICVTNPPWETIKPDSRELAALDEPTKAAYITLLKEKVFWLEKAFPRSKPTRKFSGWGANLARCGIEASVRLVKTDGVFGVVAPATIFGDQVSAPLRAWLMSTSRVKTIHHYPAEARLFEGVDQQVVYFVGDKGASPAENIQIVQHPCRVGITPPPTLCLDFVFLESQDFSIGFSGSASVSAVMPYLRDLPKLGDFESGKHDLIRLGRELDETGIARKLCKVGRYRFIKGRQVTRYSFNDTAAEYLIPDISPPASADTVRVVWRDVARQSSVRRMIATLLPPGYVTGNSLNVLSVKAQQGPLLKALLGLLNSVVFEAQVRAAISTNHLSVGAIRKIRVPDLTDKRTVKSVGLLIEAHLRDPSLFSAAEIDVAVAKWYGLPNEIYEQMLDQLEQNAPDDVAAIRQALIVNAAKECHPLK